VHRRVFDELLTGPIDWALVIDEAHCVLTWCPPSRCTHAHPRLDWVRTCYSITVPVSRGEIFRPAYGKKILGAFCRKAVESGTPVMVSSVPVVLLLLLGTETEHTLELKWDLSIGTDRYRERW
jgi:hypothetical protein